MFHLMALQRAKFSPQSLAFDSLSQDWSFDQFAWDVSAVSAALRPLAERKWRFVGIHCANLYWHWVFLFALASNGIASASLPESTSPSFLRDLYLLQPELIISLGGLSLQEIKVIEIDDAWLQRARQHVQVGEDKGPVVVGDDICRYAIAAGTDTERRVLSMTFRQVETAIMHLIFQDRLTGREEKHRSHVISTIGLVSLTGFILGCSSLCSGSTLNFVSHTDIGILIARKTPTVALVTPSHLAHILDVLSPGMQPSETLKVVVVGGKLHKALRETTLAKLTPSLQIVYGADECGPITLGDGAILRSDDMVGQCLPWVTLQIVDQEDRVMSAGVEGIIRIKSTGSLDGYVDRPSTVSRRFANGWFYPGDRGILEPDGSLRVTGRIDDLVSLDGEKFDLAIVDTISQNVLDNTKVASFVSPTSGGRTQLNIALVSETGFDGERLAQALRAFYPSLPPAHVMIVDQIPLTFDGRVDRECLGSALIQSLE